METQLAWEVVSMPPPTTRPEDRRQAAQAGVIFSTRSRGVYIYIDIHIYRSRAGL